METTQTTKTTGEELAAAVAEILADTDTVKILHDDLTDGRSWVAILAGTGECTCNWPEWYRGSARPTLAWLDGSLTSLPTFCRGCGSEGMWATATVVADPEMYTLQPSRFSAEKDLEAAKKAARRVLAELDRMAQ